MSEDVPLLPSRHGRKTSSRSSSSSSSSSSASAPNDSVPAPQLLTNFDQALSHLGTYGPWQIVVVGLLWLPAVAAGVIVLLWSFTGLEPKAFRCALKECDCDGSSSFSDADLNVYFSDNNNGDDPDFCQRPVLNGSIPDARCPGDPLLRENCSYLDKSHIVGYEACDVRGGDRVLYAPFEYKSTLVTELNLVCDDQYKVALVGTLYMVGLFFGSLLGSYPADRLGRKPMIFAFVFVAGAANLVGAFLNEFWSYAFFRTLCGVGEMGMVMVSFTLSVELVGAREQAFVGNMNQLSFAVGQIVCGVLAYYLREWRLLQLWSTACVLPLLLLWFLVPESPRWLIATRRWGRLGKVLKTAERLNGKRMPGWLVVPSSREEEEEWEEMQRRKETSAVSLLPLKITSSSSSASSGSTIVPKKTKTPPPTPPQSFASDDADDERPARWQDLLLDPVLRPRFLVMAANWALVSMAYYGIGMSMTVLGGDIFLNFVLSAVFEVAAYVICILVTDHWGRKPVIVVNFLACGVACLISGFIPDSNNAKIPLVLIGKLGSSGAFSTAYVYTAELFPTPVRGTAVGGCSTVGRIGSAAAPQLALFLPAVTFQALPLVIFGLAGLLGGLLSLLLPETLGMPLPDTTAEAGAANRGKKRFFEWWTRERLRREVRESERRIREETGRRRN